MTFRAESLTCGLVAGSHTDANGNVTTFTYNSRREMTNSVVPTNMTVKVSFDAVENINSTTDARGNATSSTWNLTRHLLTKTLPITSQGVPVTAGSNPTRFLSARTLFSADVFDDKIS